MTFSKSLFALLLVAGTVGISLPVKANFPPNTPQQIASSSTPTTYTTVRNNNEIAIQITEGEFKFHGVLKRTSGSVFTGSDNQVNVSYDQSSGRIIVKNKVTGTQFYNYIYSKNTTSSSSSSSSSSRSQTTTQYNVSKLQDLVGARASGGETQLKQRGYVFVSGAEGGYTYWKNSSTGECIVVRTDNGNYTSITASPNECVDSTVDEGAL